MTTPPTSTIARAACLVATALLVASCTTGARPPARTDLGVDPATLGPVVDHPYVAFSSVKRALYEGEEVDPDTDETIALRVESVVRDTTTTVAGVEVTIVDVLDYEDGELVEKTEDYYAQDAAGTVYYMGESVSEYEDGELVGHEGQWLPGVNGNLAGVFMPADPKVGDVFEQERAPGVAEDRSTLVRAGVTVTVPAGTLTDCIETEDVDPLGGATESKFYCRGVGLAREVFPEGGSLDLIEYETR